MLDSFIIEELRRREEERRREAERPRLELPLHPERNDPDAEPRRERDEERSRGVVVIDL